MFPGQLDRGNELRSIGLSAAFDLRELRDQLATPCREAPNGQPLGIEA